LAYDIPNFIWDIRTYPDLVIVCGRNEILEELDRILLISTQTNTQLLSYDTTFKFGDFYVSAILFRAVCFRENPVIPALFLIHERKLRTTHEALCAVLSQKVKALSNSNVVVVTDCEKSFEVFADVFKNITHLHCWNHIFRDIILWVTRHAGNSKDAAVYVQHVRDLLQTSSLAKFETLLAEKMSVWSGPFLKYFKDEVEPNVNTKKGR